jgi:histidinol-phosphate aminotransferase
MSESVNRRQWLTSTGLAAGSALLAPRLLSGMDRTGMERSAPGARSYEEVLTQLERDVTAARRAAGPIRLAYNENPFGMSPKAKEAITANWSEHSQYNLASIPELQKTFAQSVGVPPEYVLITQGSGEVLDIAAIAYGLHGREVVTSWPTFEGLPRYAEAMGSVVHKVGLTKDLDHDLAALDARITNATGLVFMCNPNNPTGILPDQAKVRDFVRSTAHKALVVVDEAYHDFVDAPGYSSMTDLVLKGENIIVSRTASKIHGIAGLRIGFAIARPDIIARLGACMTGTPNAFGVAAATASIRDTTYQDFVRARNKEGRELLTKTLQGMGKRVAPSQTNFVFFQSGVPVETVQARMKAKGFLTGRPFPPYTDWCRISIGTPDEMKQLVAVLPEALKA